MGSSAAIHQRVEERMASAISIFEIDTQVIRRLRPTHILTQTLCDVCAVSLVDVQSSFNTSHELESSIVSCNGRSVAGVWEDIRNIAGSLGYSAAGEALVVNLQARMETLAIRAGNGANRPSVVTLEWLDPLMAGGNWVPELIALAGGKNLAGCAGEHSPWLDWEEVRSADPDVIVGLPCGFNLERTRLEMHGTQLRPGWFDLKAVRSGRVYLCDGNQFMNRPGPRLAESAQIFAEILHPELFPPLLEGVGWERY